MIVESNGASVHIRPAGKAEEKPKSPLPPPPTPLTTQMSQASSRSQRDKLIIKRQRRTNLMLCVMVLIFAACWSLFVAINFLRDSELLPNIVQKQEAFCQIFAHCLAVSSTMWNPILYGAMNEQFRAAFAQIASVFCDCCHWKCFKNKSAPVGSRFLSSSSSQK